MFLEIYSIVARDKNNMSVVNTCLNNGYTLHHRPRNTCRKMAMVKMAMEQMAMEQMAMEQMAMEIMVMEKMAMEIMAICKIWKKLKTYFIL